MAPLTVIMPVHNAEKFLRQSLDSVLAQSFSDFELLLGDDASTDRSSEILAEYARKDPRLKVLRNQVQSGVAKTLNKLLESAVGELVARMDADDICEPERFARQVQFLGEHPRVDFVGTQLSIINESGAVIGSRKYPTDFAEIRRIILTRNVFAHPTMMMRREAVTSLGGYREITGCEDYELWLRAIDRGLIMANLCEPLLRYRISAEQEKRRNLKPALRATLRLQRNYLFNRNFFSLSSFFTVIAAHGLLLLPDGLIMKLFMKVTYSPDDKK